MWYGIVAAAVALCGGLWWLVRHRAEPDRDLDEFFTLFRTAIREAGPEYDVRGAVPGTLTMVVSVRGQEVPVPLDNIFRHHQMFPDQMDVLVGQLLEEIEEVGLERPADRIFADSATKILPQVCTEKWVFDHGPAFGESAIVHRDLGPGLVLCYVIDDPWSMVYVCNAHLHNWGRTEEDLFHLAVQNLRRNTVSGLPLPRVGEEPVSVRHGDGYDAARVLLLDPDAAEDLLIAMPQQETLLLGRREDPDRLEALLRVSVADPVDHPVSDELFCLEDTRLVPAAQSTWR